MRRKHDEDYWPTFGGENFAGEGGPVNWMHPGESGPHAGVGPRNYRRPDDRIVEDVIGRLTRHGMIDATDMEVTARDGEVTLAGTVENRQMKSLAEHEADSVWGVTDVQNQLRIRSRQTAA